MPKDTQPEFIERARDAIKRAGEFIEQMAGLLDR